MFFDMSKAIAHLNEALSDRYRVERELGEGGMATVYLADDLRHGRKVAIKVLKPELAAVVGAERFLAEIETTASLQHPHILPLFDSGNADGFLFYVMPYVEGESLRERLERERQLPVDEAVAIARDVAEALDYAHRRGVVHRDIKPANILLHEGRPQLADFGIALAVGAGSGGRITETGLSLGTPLYMSPEQASGDRKVGSPTDIYALGCVLYEMLVGEPPYRGPTAQAILGRIMTGTFEAPREARHAVPPNVDAAVCRALERLPADRFATARDFADALADPTFRHGESPDGIAVGRWKRIAAGLAALSVVLALAVGWLLTADAPAAGGAPSPRFASLLLPSGRSVSTSTRAPLSVSADGARLAYRVVDDDGEGEVWLRSFSDPEPVHLPALDGSLGSVALSPDGAWIAFHDPVAGEIRRMPTVGGAAETVGATGVTGEAFLGLTWEGDGTLLFTTAEGIRRVPAGGGEVVELTGTDPEGTVQHSSPSLLPDGTGILFTRTDGSSSRQQLMILPFGDSEPTVLTDGHSGRITPEGILVFGADVYRDRRLWAAPLSDDLSALAAPPVAMVEGVFQRQIAPETPQLIYALSDDGTLVYRPSDGPAITEYVWADREGRFTPILRWTDPQFPRGITGFGHARVSPKGDRLAISGFFGSPPLFRLFIYDLRRRVLSPLSVEVNADWPVWTPDGERIAFNRFLRDEQNLYWTRADGAGEPEPLIPPNSHQQHAQSFSADGRFLVYQHSDVPNTFDSDLWLLPLDGSGETRPVVESEGLQRSAALSPDGRWLAYASDESGRSEVYVTDFPDGRTRMKISSGGASSPVWAPDGEELFYTRAGYTGVMAVPVDLEGSVSPGRPELLFQGRFQSNDQFGRGLDIHPDGQRFLLERVVDDRPRTPRLEVVYGWTAHVAERVGR